ncbi:MAG: hypothetical protein JKY22_12370 [Flavobacteriaceae bacterium]|nr:hypothetical protein [Flavobacteriaceae bacterium]
MNNQQKEILTKEIEEESKAELILNGTNQYFIEYKAQLFEESKATGWKEVDKREEIYRQLKSIDVVQSKLLTAIQTGSMAREQLSAWQKAKNRLKVI